MKNLKCKGRGFNCPQCKQKEDCIEYVGLDVNNITVGTIKAKVFKMPKYETFKIDKDKIKNVGDLINILDALNMTTYTIDVNGHNKNMEIIRKYMKKV